MLLSGAGRSGGGEHRERVGARGVTWQRARAGRPLLPRQEIEEKVPRPRSPAGDTGDYRTEWTQASPALDEAPPSPGLCILTWVTQGLLGLMPQPLHPPPTPGPLCSVILLESKARKELTWLRDQEPLQSRTERGRGMGTGAPRAVGKAELAPAGASAERSLGEASGQGFSLV